MRRGDCIRPALPLRSWAAQEPQQLLLIEPVAADDAAIEKQDRNMEAMAPRQLGVAIDIHNFDARQRHAPAERFELCQHVLAQLTILAVHDRDACGHTIGAARQCVSEPQ